MESRSAFVIPTIESLREPHLLAGFKPNKPAAISVLVRKDLITSTTRSIALHLVVPVDCG